MVALDHHAPIYESFLHSASTQTEVNSKYLMRPKSDDDFETPKRLEEDEEDDDFETPKVLYILQIFQQAYGLAITSS